MPRKTKTQWDFGDLFDQQSTRRVYSVSELTGAVKSLLERELGLVWVTGELSNFRLQSSGHCYFTLKDEGAQLSCVLFRGTPTSCRDLLEDGRKVIAQGELTVYEPRGQYQLVLRQLEFQGVGALQAAFERLKQRLQAEGLFATARKRPVPDMVGRLGVVTSPTGAALRDVLHVVSRRNPGLELVLAPSRVQGEGAAAELVEGIARLNAWSTSGSERRLDAILITRGGGSLEDLWAFNEESLARAIANSELPVVSAVGHEIDFTISDFVADLRAATPSAAAELLTEGAYASRAFVVEGWRRLRLIMQDRLAGHYETVEHLLARIGRAHPRRRLEVLGQRLDELESGLTRVFRGAWRLQAAAWLALYHRWRILRPHWALQRRQEALAALYRRLAAAAPAGLTQARHRLLQAETRLRLLSPQSVLERGFSITTDAATGNVLRGPDGLRPGQLLRTRLQRGEVVSRVDSTG